MSNPDIKLAKFAGFCYGVKRAVETAIKLKKENPDKNIYILGELIHNTDVINELEKMGIKTINEIPEQGDGICIVRSHVQQRAVELAKNDYFVVIVGKSNHPEVMAIKANADLYSDKVVVAASIEELAPYEAEIKSHRRVGVVVQTTQMVSSLNLIVNYLNTIAKEVLIYNTICQSTAMRQKEAKELAKESDLMIVVGSKKSANTSHLAEILKACTKTVHIENDTELNTELLEGVKSIGITAGASTPQKIIDKVIDKIQKGK